MLNRTSAILAAVAAAIVVAVAAGSASAGNLSVSNRTFRITWSSVEFSSSEGTLIRCPVTLEGSYHSGTLRKVVGALLGYITRAPVASGACTNGIAEEAAFGNESLPWHVRYESFTGTLPNIASVKLRIFGKRERIRILGQICIYHPPVAGLQAIANIAGGVIATIALEVAASLVYLAGPVCCPPTITDGGTGRYAVLGAATAVTVRLI